MKIILKLLLAFVCVVTVLVAYEVYFPWEDKARERTFHQRLEKKVAAGETKIYLRDLTDFEWDSMYVIPHEYSSEELSRVLGFVYSGYIPSVLCDPYQKADFAFVQGNEVKIVNYGCSLPTLCPAIKGSHYRLCKGDAFLSAQKQMQMTKQRPVFVLSQGE